MYDDTSNTRTFTGVWQPFFAEKKWETHRQGRWDRKVRTKAHHIHPFICSRSVAACVTTPRARTATDRDVAEFAQCYWDYHDLLLEISPGSTLFLGQSCKCKQTQTILYLYKVNTNCCRQIDVTLHTAAAVHTRERRACGVHLAVEVASCLCSLWV